MPHSITLETIDTDIQRLGIKTIELQYLDPIGDIHSMNVSATKLRFIDGEYQLVANDIAGTLDGSSVSGFQNIDKTGLELVPGPNPRIYVDPTEPSRLVVMGNTKEPNGPLYAKDPRNQAMIAEQWLLQQDLGLKALRIGPEFEFFVFPANIDQLAFDADNRNYHCAAASNPNQKFMEEYLAALQLAGVDSRFFHAEVATHQNEIGVNCETLLRAADNVIIQRDILKKLAVKYGVCVSWEPKLLDAYAKTIMKTTKDGAINGSGLHTNMSFDTVDGKNAFVTFDEDGRPVTNQLSEDAHLCIAGLLKHANGLQAIFNPSTISGARLGMGESPKFIVAGNDNRSALIRIVTISVGEEFKTRIELRASDSMCCPHTWFAAAQMAMVDAIRSGRGKSNEAREALGLIPKIINTNFYQMTEQARLEYGIPELHTGSDILSKSIQSFLGDHAYLLSPNGPFAQSVHSVLTPYLDTIVEADREREILRSEKAAKWIQAPSAATSAEMHALTIEMQTLKSKLAASEARQDLLERMFLALMGSLQVSEPSAHTSLASRASFFGSCPSPSASQSEDSSSSRVACKRD